MADQRERKPARIVNETGATMMALDSLGREGNRILIHGRMMGSMPAKMYMSPEDAWRMGGMMLRNPAVISYAFALPFILLKRRGEKSEQ